MSHRREFAIALVLAVGILLAGCGAPQAPMEMPAEAAPAANMPAATPVPGELGIVGAQVRPAVTEGGNGAAFFTVENGLDHPVQLLAASTAAAQSAEFHESVDENGVMKMVAHPEGFTVDAGASLDLAPGGKHMMLFGMNKVLKAGDTISVTLTFSPEQTLEVTMPVVDLGDGM